MRKILIWLALLFGLLSTTLAQSGVRAVVVNEFANIRIIPAIGAEVITTVQAGYLFEDVTARSADGAWIRINFNGEEGWVNLAPLTVLSGDVNALPVADPRTIPFGGFEAPRAGFTSATSNIQGRLAESGLRVRAGPSTGYPVLANAPRFTVFPVLGRNASSTWLQVNFEGTLGWVRSAFVELSVPFAQIPVGGIIADSPPLAGSNVDDFAGTLRLMLARLDLAQPSLDTIRAYWTDAALTGRASCRPYPAQPSDFNIPDQLLALFFNDLNPLIELFNDAMFNLRQSIRLFIDVCEQPGLQNPVGEATAIGALDAIALADRQFAELRRRINDLIPPERELGEDECLFVFDNQAEILPIIPVGTIVIDSFNPRRFVSGYCVEATAGELLIVETYQRPNSNIVHRVSVSPLENPTSFLTIQQGAEGTPLLTVGPIFIPADGLYLVVLSDIAQTGDPPFGEFALLVWKPTGVFTSILNYNEETDEFFIGSGAAPTPTPVGFPPGGGGPPGTTSGLNENTSVVCPGTGLTCEQLSSCEEAYACLGQGNFTLDPDNDGIPCEVLRCPSGP